MRVLVAIANYGTGNRQYLESVLDAYRLMPIDVKIVVLSDRPKDLGEDIEVRVGLPSKNPWSLPFAHRSLFRERLNDYDWFVYSEDDTLLNYHNLTAVVEASKLLGKTEIAGFLRTEKSVDGNIYYSSCHSHFRWFPGSVRERTGHLWAAYSNEHAACFVASREQLTDAIHSGGFPLAPHEGRYDMLVSAATDIYSQCGMERLLCLDRLDDFTLPHLPNKYIGRMGLPCNEMDWQLDALRKIYRGESTEEEMCDPETKFPGSYGSKHFREEPDPFLQSMVDPIKGLVVVWGAGDGLFEQGFVRPGRRVGVVAFNAVMAECCKRRGIDVLGIARLAPGTARVTADALILADVLHLVRDPHELLMQVQGTLKSSGTLLIRVPNFRNISMIKRRWKNPAFRLPLIPETTGAFAFTEGQLTKLLQRSGYTTIDCRALVTDRLERINKLTFGFFSSNLSQFLYIIAKKK